VELGKRLVKESPTAESYLRLARSHNNRGHLLRSLDRRGEAATAFRQAIAADEKVAELAPAVPEHRQGLAVANNNLGNLLTELGKPDEGAKLHRQALTIRRKLADDFPTVPEYRADLAISYGSLGAALLRLGELKEAAACLRRAVELADKLVALYPTVPGHRREQARSCSDLGAVLLKLGELAAAEAALLRAVGLHRKLVEEFPKVPNHQSEMALALNNLAVLWRRQPDRLAEVKSLQTEAVQHQRRALRAMPAHPHYRHLLREHYLELAETLAKLREHAALARVAEELPQVEPRNPVGWYEAASALARCVSLTANDVTLTAQQRDKLSKAYADAAMRMLRTAVQKGFRDTAHMKKRNTNLNPLRSRDDFKELLAELETKQVQRKPATEKK
jgi:tetratricopeptide (TPR) repeat protein